MIITRTALVMIIASDVTTLQQRGKYNGFIGAAVALGSGMGPLIGGAITAHVSWRWTYVAFSSPSAPRVYLHM